MMGIKERAFAPLIKPQQLAFATKPFKEHHQLQFEEDDGVNRGASSSCIGLRNELAHKRQIKCSLHMALEVIVGNQLLEGDIDERGKGALLHSHHSHRLSSLHPSFERTGGLTLQGR